MEPKSTNFNSQLLIFFAIILSALALTFLASYFKDDLKKLGLKAAAAAQDSGKAFKDIMTEDLDPDY